MNNLRLYRSKVGIKLQQAIASTRLPREVYTEIEGHTAFPTPKIADKIADGLISNRVTLGFNFTDEIEKIYSSIHSTFNISLRLDDEVINDLFGKDNESNVIDIDSKLERVIAPNISLASVYCVAYEPLMEEYNRLARLNTPRELCKFPLIDTGRLKYFIDDIEPPVRGSVRKAYVWRDHLTEMLSRCNIDVNGNNNFKFMIEYLAYYPNFVNKWIEDINKELITMQSSFYGEDTPMSELF